jgi:hypothetical protein
MSTHTQPTFEQIGEDWIGMLGGRRTMLKRTLAWARHDVAHERFVCAHWPHCLHRDADACGRAGVRHLPRWRADEERTR